MYLKVLVDLRDIFGNLDRLRIAEIGIGYGGQCRSVLQLHRVRHYDLFDLPTVNLLAQRFLETSGVDTSTLTFHDGRAPKFCESDLLISNYAFSELRRDVQEAYMESVVSHATRGYVTYNPIASQTLGAMTASEFAERLPGARMMEEVPLTHPDNVVIVWGA
jgi:putative sugar O-methyltransferase